MIKGLEKKDLEDRKQGPFKETEKKKQKEGCRKD